MCLLEPDLLVELNPQGQTKNVWLFFSTTVMFLGCLAFIVVDLLDLVLLGSVISSQVKTMSSSLTLSSLRRILMNVDFKLLNMLSIDLKG